MRFVLILLAASAITACADTAERPELTVAAASSLIPLLEEIEPAFEAEEEADLVFTYAASGTLARQIENGAPIDLFLSMDAALVDSLSDQSLLLEESIAKIGHGLLVAVRPVGGTTTNFLDAERIAIANPELAPYGVAAKRLLEVNDVWVHVADRVVYAESALQALQYVRSAEADIGLVPVSLARAYGDDVEAVDDLVWRAPGGEHVILTAAVTSTAEDASLAQRFIELLTAPENADVLEDNGILPLPERTPGVQKR